MDVIMNCEGVGGGTTKFENCLKTSIYANVSDIGVLKNIKRKKT